MRRALVLQHVAFEGPAAIGTTLEAMGFQVEVRRLDRGEAVPSSLADGELLIVMGGPMGLTDIGSPKYPFLDAEVRLLRSCLASQRPVLGVCLGAQLLASAASARVAPMVDADAQRVFELGWAPLDIHASELGAQLLAGLGDELTVFHWHGDAFEVPAGGVRLASTAVCPTQAFLLPPCAIGLQFHIEVGAGGIEELIRVDEGFLQKARGPEGPRLIREETAQSERRSLAARQRFLRNILEFLAAC